jgi:hypothetical protein
MSHPWISYWYFHTYPTLCGGELPQRVVECSRRSVGANCDGRMGKEGGGGGRSFKLGRESMDSSHQCCRSGSGIRCSFVPESGIRDGGKIRIPDEGSTFQIIFSVSLETDFWLKVLENSLMRIRIRDLFSPGSRMKKFWFGIRYKHSRFLIATLLPIMPGTVLKHFYIFTQEKYTYLHLRLLKMNQLPKTYIAFFAEVYRIVLSQRIRNHFLKCLIRIKWKLIC